MIIMKKSVISYDEARCLFSELQEVLDKWAKKYGKPELYANLGVFGLSLHPEIKTPYGGMGSVVMSMGRKDAIIHAISAAVQSMADDFGEDYEKQHGRDREKAAAAMKAHILKEIMGCGLLDATDKELDDLIQSPPSHESK